MAPKTSPKKDFVVSFGLQKPVAEILAAAEKSGMKLSRAYIDILRKKLGGSKGATAKRKPGRPKKSASAASSTPKRGPGRPKSSTSSSSPASSSAAAAPAKRRGRPPKSAGTASSSSSSGDSAFRTAAAHIVIESGAARARQLLEDVVSRIRSSAG